MTTVYVLSGSLVFAVIYILLLLWRFQRFISAHTPPNSQPVPQWDFERTTTTTYENEPSEEPAPGTGDR